MERAREMESMTGVKWQEVCVLVGVVSVVYSDVWRRLGQWQKEFIGFAGNPFQSGWRDV